MTAAETAEVEDEPLRIRLANIGDLLGWDLLGWDRTERIESHEIQVNKMIALLSRSRIKLSPTEAIKTVTAVHLLAHVFYQRYGIDEPDRRAHREQLWIDISRGLMKVVYNCLDQDDYSGARRLVLETFRMYQRFLLTNKSMRLTFKLLMGPRLVRVIKGFMRREVA
jgi:hypothetical protein